MYNLSPQVNRQVCANISIYTLVKLTVRQLKKICYEILPLIERLNIADPMNIKNFLNLKEEQIDISKMPNDEEIRDSVLHQHAEEERDAQE